jgi:hypothetical protein
MWGNINEYLILSLFIPNMKNRINEGYFGVYT